MNKKTIAKAGIWHYSAGVVALKQSRCTYKVKFLEELPYRNVLKLRQFMSSMHKLPIINHNLACLHISVQGFVLSFYHFV